MGTLKTNDEIKKGLERYLSYDDEDCEETCKSSDCPYRNDPRLGEASCGDLILDDVRTLIQRLENDASFYKNIAALNDRTIDEQAGCIQDLERKNAELLENIKWMEAERDDFKRTIRQLQAERDAAVSDINIARPCRICRNLENDQVCAQCSVGGREFEWRGAKKEET